jgi:pyruvate/2-oxoglutarate dehydrogenase complex dihydrolipoamide acyltransferase (E2) component
MSKPEIICECEIHPAASIFPLMEGDRFQSLVDSIAVHGLQNPIVCSGNVVLDGRNRLRAVEKLRNEGHEVELRAVQWECGDSRLTETEWITAQNLDRRHLSEDAYVAAQAALNRILRKEAKARQAKGQAKPGQQSKNPAGRRGKKTGGDQTVAASSRDSKKKDAASTAGQVAAKAGVSLRKAKQAVKLDQAVEAGVISEEVQKDVIAGKKKLRDAVKQVPAKQKAASKPTQKKKRPACDVLDDLRLLLHELLACDRVSRQQIVDELTTWIDRANNN